MFLSNSLKSVIKLIKSFSSYPVNKFEFINLFLIFTGKKIIKFGTDITFVFWILNISLKNNEIFLFGFSFFLI